MRILSLLVLVACVAVHTNARAQDEDARAVATRGLLAKRGHLAKGKPTTTTTTTAAPEEEEEYEDEAEEAEGDNQEPSTEAPPSSTEGKKLVAGGVRPFRSNTDLLETLKRRRAQAAEAKLQGHSPTASSSQDAPTEAPVKANFNKKRFNNGKTESAKSEDAPAAAKPSRNRFSRPSSGKSFQEAEVDEQNDAAPPVKTGRAYIRRAGF